MREAAAASLSSAVPQALDSAVGLWCLPPNPVHLRAQHRFESARAQ